MRLALVCFYCLCVFVYVFYFIATMSFAGYFLSVLFCLLSMLISDSRFDLVWFCLSCDHGWIRSGSVNVRKQQQSSTAICPELVRSRNYDTRRWRSLPRVRRHRAGSPQGSSSTGGLFKCNHELIFVLLLFPAHPLLYSSVRHTDNISVQYSGGHTHIIPPRNAAEVHQCLHLDAGRS